MRMVVAAAAKGGRVVVVGENAQGGRGENKVEETRGDVA